MTFALIYPQIPVKTQKNNPRLVKKTNKFHGVARRRFFRMFSIFFLISIFPVCIFEKG